MLAELGKWMDNTVRTSTKRQKILKNAKQVIIELKNTPEGFNSRLDEVEEWINELENKAMELTQTEQQNENRI